MPGSLGTVRRFKVVEGARGFPFFIVAEQVNGHGEIRELIVAQCENEWIAGDIAVGLTRGYRANEEEVDGEE